MARLNQERQAELQPERMKFAINDIQDRGYTITYQDESKLQFEFKGHTVTYFPYSGWASGKSIIDGRGIEHLLKQITPKQ